MSVLETFFILFKTDADAAAKGVEKVEDAADGAEDALRGVDRNLKETKNSANAAAAATTKVAASTAAADANAKRLAASFMSMAKSIAAPVLGLLSVGALSNIVTGRAANIRQLDAFSTKLNSTIQDVDAFQRSVQQLGGEGAAALDSMVKIGEKINEAFSDRESGAAKDFQAWGMAFTDTEGKALGAADAMLELADSIEGLSQAEALARIKKLGIEDATTIELLMKGRTEVERQIDAQKRLGVVTEEQAKATRDYYRELGTMNNLLTSFGNSLVSMLLPGMTATIRAFNSALEWMASNRRLVEGFFIGVATAITAYFLPSLAAAATAVIAAIWPFALIGAAAAALGAAFALAYEDVRAFMDGQPSLIGELAKRYEWFADIVRGVGAAFVWLAGEWERFKQDVSALSDELLGYWETWKTAATETAQAFGPIFQPLVEAFSALFTSVGEIVEAIRGLGGAAQDAQSAATPAMEAIKSVLNSIKPVIDAVATAFRVVLGGAVKFVSGLVGALAGAVSRIASAISGVQVPAITPEQAAANDNARQTMGQRGGLRGPMRDSALAAGQTSLGAAAAAPQGLAASAGRGGGAKTNNVTQTNNVTINAQGLDAAGVRREFDRTMTNRLQDAAAQFDTGVDR